MATDEDGGPTFEDLLFDDALDDLQRVKTYTASRIALQRLVHVKMLANVAEEFEFDKLEESLFPVLDKLTSDEEFVIRQHLAEQIRGLAAVCASTPHPNGYRVLVEQLLYLLGKLAADNMAEVRIAAGETLVAVAKLVKPDDLGPRVLTIVLQLAHDDIHEDLRMTAAVLLNELAETLGPDLCHQFVVPEVICLSEDAIFRVRKAAALNMDAVCRTAGAALCNERLLPAFVKLSKDDVWGVRKACAESLVAVSKSIDPSSRITVMVPIFERYTTDPSKWVRQAAFQHLGPFIATLSSAQVTPGLLKHYIDMAAAQDADDKSDAFDPDMPAYCAFSFPAVAVTIGKDRWAEISGLFHTLARDQQRKVRKPMAHSLHEIAKLLGEHTAETELLSTFHLYLKDVDEVKVGVIKNLAGFLGALSADYRESYLPILDEIQSCTSPLNWRFRMLLAEQFPQLTSLFSPAATCSVVTSVMLKILDDPVWIVREAACFGVPSLLRRLAAADPQWEADVIVKLHKFSVAKNYKSRQLYLKMCDVLLHDAATTQEWFRRYFFAGFLSMGQDPVSNVRLAFLHTLCDKAVPDWLRQLPAVIEVVSELVRDGREDVRLVAHTVPIPSTMAAGRRAAVAMSPSVAAAPPPPTPPTKPALSPQRPEEGPETNDPNDIDTDMSTGTPVMPPPLPTVAPPEAVPFPIIAASPPKPLSPSGRADSPIPDASAGPETE